MADGLSLGMGAATFHAIAEELRLAAHREAMGLEFLEVELARPDTFLTDTMVEPVRLSAARLAQAHRLFLALIPFEAAIKIIAEHRS